MGGGAIVAAAAAAKRRRQQEVIDAFRLGDATSPDRARPIEQLGLLAGDEAQELVASGVLVQGRAPGTFYLNEAMYIANRDQRNVPRRALLVLAVVLMVLGIIALGALVRSQ